MFSSKKRAQAAAAAQARQEAALRGAGLGISTSLANRKEQERTTSASTTTSRATGLASPPLASPIFGIPPPPPSSGAARQWKGQLHQRTESNSTSTTATADKSLASPKLGLTFDFELPPSPALSSGDAFGTDAFFRPSTSDGPNVGFGEETGRRSSVTAPVLPSVSQASSRREAYQPSDSEDEEDEPLAAIRARFQRVDAPVDRVQDLPRKPKAPPPPIPIAAPAQEQKPLISSPSLPPPRIPQIPSATQTERSSSPALQLPPRLSSRTPSAERLPTLSSLQPTAPSQPPPLQVTKQAQIATPPPSSVPPPPSIPPPEIPPSKDNQRDKSDTVSLHSNKSFKSKRSRIKSFFFDKPNPDFLSQSRPSSSAGAAKMSNSSQELRPSTSAGSVPTMESSLFPRKEPSLPRQDSLPVMNRAWLDARDKPYQNVAAKPVPGKRPYLQQTQSTPDLLAAPTNPSGNSRVPSMPVNLVTHRSPLAASASADASPQSPRLTFVRPTGSFPKTSMSAEEEVAPSPTVGTPYQQTSPEFPLPEHVATRPKTAGGSASTMGGHSVPTHYSKAEGRPEASASGKPDKDEKSEKKERRKTRLLNPMNLLSRRRSGEDEEVAQKEKAVQAAQVQALRKQKTVVASGVDRVPENFDPRIKGKVVHDFSVPRHGRGPSIYMSDGSEPAWNAVARGLQSAQSAPFLPNDGRESQASGTGSGSGRHLSVSTMATSSSGPDRRSRNVANMGAFHEHLSETPDRGSRISSLQAERRENKDFLQRASHLSQQSQESGVLPPFARRNQAIDSMPYYDGGEPGRGTEQSGKVSALSNRWNDGRDSGISALSGVSPVTARTSSAIGGHDMQHSFSPVSPTSPGGSKLGSDGRPGSAVSPSGTEDRPPSSYFSAGLDSKSSRPTVSPLDDREKTGSPARSPARSPGNVAKEEATPKKDKKKSVFSIKIPFRGAEDVLPRGPSGASANSNASPLTSPTSRSVKSVKSAKSGRSVKSGRSLAGTPSVHSLPSNQPTPEPQIAEPAIIVTTSKSPKLVEKLATAVGHGKKGGNKKDKLEHQASNASRFSFQFGGSAAEELALEEKARKMRANGQPVSNPLGDEEDEDDFFDEDALDDMDEMEMQAQTSEQVPGDDGYVTNYVGGKPLSLQQQVQLLQAQQAQQPQQQAQQQVQQVEEPDATINGASANPARASQFMYRNATPTSKANRNSKLPLQLDIQENDSGVSEDDDDPNDESDDESGYWAHDDFMDYSQTHTREPSIVTAVAASPAVVQTGSPALPPGTASSGNSPQQPRRRTRGASAASARGLTLNTNVGPSSTVPQPADVRAVAAAFVQDTLNQQARSGFHMQPAAAGYTPGATNTNINEHPDERPVVPHRDSGNSERNRIASGLAFRSADDGAAGHKAAHSSSTVGSAGRSTVSGSSSSGPRTTSTGLGLSVFSDFKFTESAPPSRPLSLEKAIQDRRSGDSETIPRDVNWTEGSPALNQHGRSSSGWTSEGNGVQFNGTPSKHVSGGQTRDKTTYLDIVDDDVYFDDGGFDLDIAEGPNVRGSVNESAFDEDGFDFDRINGVGEAVQLPNHSAPQPGHSRDISALTVTSLGSDGPYPSFAMPNAAKARQRDSSYLLEDLPLQEQAVDPRYVPRRNPSEDAKRLGLSDKVPPLPAQPGSAEAVQRASASLQAYHSALAAAANKAAAEGRFSRMPSISTTSVYSQGEGESHMVSRDTSHYSRNENGESLTNEASDSDRNESVESSHSRVGQDTDYTSPKMNFDFGFGSSIGFDDDLNDLDNDDDIVAAANAEALASDDEGFYGQEFGFYAKARPNSGEVQALIGGYFGEDGDDGLTRNKSTKEPNLTPITERSEFSTRNSFIGMGGFGPASAGGPMSAGSMSSLSPALARLPYSPLMDGEVTSFDQLRKLRAHAFGGSNASLGGSNGSLHSAGSDGRNSNTSLQLPSDSPTWSARSSAAAQGYFGPSSTASQPLGGSSESEASSNAASAHPQPALLPVFHDSPHSAASSGHLPFSMDNEATPKRPPRDSGEAPLTARKAPPPGMAKMSSHSRQSSKDSVTYVQEQDPAGTGQPRWVLERRRTSEQGQLELVAREIVQGGWI